MKTTVTDIRQGASAEEYFVTVLVEGHRKTFRTWVDLLPGSGQTYGLQIENSLEFETVFECSMAPKKIVGIVVRIYKGEIVQLPVDLGDI